MISFRPKAPADEFVAFLNAELRCYANWEWDLRSGDDESVIEVVFFALEEGGPKVRMELLWTPNWELLDVVATCPQEGRIWEPRIRELLVRADERALDDSRVEFLTQHRYVYMGYPLSGSFEIGQFRVDPWVSVPSEPMGRDVERAVVFQIPFRGTDVQDAYSLSHTLASEFASFLSVVLRVGFYIIRRERRWTVDGRRWLTFPPGPPADVHAGEVDDARTRIGFDLTGELSNRIRMPRFADRLWRKLLQADRHSRVKFTSAATLFNMGLVAGRRFPSVRMFYQLAAIEPLLEKRGGQRIGTLFCELVDRLCPEKEGFAKSERLYGRYRSGHAHEGDFAAGEFEGEEFGPFKGRWSTGLAAWTPMQIEAISATVLLRWLDEQ